MLRAPDGSALSDEHRIEVERFAAQASVPPADALHILQTHNWDYEVALRSIIGGTSSQATSQQSGWVWWLATSPYQITKSAVSYMMGWNSGGVVEEEWSAFTRRFEEAYGTLHPPFFQGSLSQALSRSRADSRLLLIYLHSEHHADTPSFCRGTLCTEAVCSFVAEHMVMWAGDVSQPQGFSLLNSLEVSAFPFCAVVAARADTMVIAERIYGPRSADEFIAVLTSAISGAGGAILEQNRRAAADRALIEERNRAYEESLAADREKDRRRAEEEARKREEERVKAERKAAAAARRAARAEALARAAEVRADAAPGDSATVAVRLPDGSRVSRRFAADERLEVAFALADTGVPEPGMYRLCTNFPRREFGEDEAQSLTLRDAGLCPQALLFVTRIDEDDGEAAAAGASQPPAP
eukprot:m51a1_g11907 putative fas-associated factor 2-b-like (412) ;mRNA; f:629449-630949